MQTLTNGQKQALLESQNGHNIFISGGGGVGKSYISQIIVDELQAAGKTVLITASTGKAAMLINGVTCHRAFRIPIRMTWSATPKITPKDPIYPMRRKTPCFSYGDIRRVHRIYASN